MCNYYIYLYYMGNDINKIVNLLLEYKNENNILYLVEINKIKFNIIIIGYNKIKEEIFILYYV